MLKLFVHRLLVCSCALYLSGAHWVLLQATAWTGMLFTRSLHAPVVEAVATTFDGEHPCRMCSAISEGQKEEKQKEREYPLVKKSQELRLVVLEVFDLPPCAVSGEAQWPDFVAVAPRRTEAPPTPPPLV